MSAQAAVRREVAIPTCRVGSHNAQYHPAPIWPGRRVAVRERILRKTQAKLHIRGRRGSSEVAILFVDLDDLKTINDGIGHEAGDQAIRETARRLSRFTRSSDALARFGGDEFLLLVADAPNRSGIGLLATRILRAIQEPMVLGESEHTIRGSVGVAIFPDDAETVESLVQAADAAMFRAKAKGGDQYVIADQGMQTGVSRPSISGRASGSGRRSSVPDMNPVPSSAI